MALVIFGEFEWDSDKAAENLSKHGVSFEEATTVLDRLDSVDEQDLLDPSRTLTVGFSFAARILLVVSTERGARTRVISARKANPNEQSKYRH
jgi:uncharacterized protein